MKAGTMTATMVLAMPAFAFAHRHFDGANLIG
jgi:hypothetical protein